MPGPKAILYFLQQDAELQAAGVSPPRSTATVWQVLRRHGRIPQRRRPAHEPVDLPPPLTSWQLDFEDVSTVPSEPLRKRQHGVEALNCVDCGTSLLVAADVRADFTSLGLPDNQYTLGLAVDWVGDWSVSGDATGQGSLAARRTEYTAPYVVRQAQAVGCSPDHCQ